MEERKDETAFVHRSTSENIRNNSTYIDHPWANKNPNAILLVTQVRGRDGDAANVHPTGVWYDANRGGKWAIFNQDLMPMDKGEIFNVAISEGPSKSMFVHRATSENTVDNQTYVDHSPANKNPDAVFLVTPDWNPGGGAGTYNDHFVSVRYKADEEKWAILNQNTASMPVGTTFNMAVSDSTQTSR